MPVHNESTGSPSLSSLLCWGHRRVQTDSPGRTQTASHRADRGSSGRRKQEEICLPFDVGFFSRDMSLRISRHWDDRHGQTERYRDPQQVLQMFQEWRQRHKTHPHMKPDVTWYLFFIFKNVSHVWNHTQHACFRCNLITNGDLLWNFPLMCLTSTYSFVFHITWKKMLKLIVIKY